jgi:aromatic amino acid aminotransferase I
VPVETDAFGLVPEDFSRKMAKWDSLYPGIAKPRVIYTIPTGANPSGGTLSVDRREALYATAKQYGARFSTGIYTRECV